MIKTYLMSADFAGPLASLEDLALEDPTLSEGPFVVSWSHWELEAKRQESTAPLRLRNRWAGQVLVLLLSAVASGSSSVPIRVGLDVSDPWLRPGLCHLQSTLTPLLALQLPTGWEEGVLPSPPRLVCKVGPAFPTGTFP